MGIVSRIFGGRSESPGAQSGPAVVAGDSEASNYESLVQLDIVGESHRQDALAAIAGPKAEVSKSHAVPVTLRCEPSNQYDSNAIRVEALGHLVGYVAREQAALLGPQLLRVFQGVLGARGLIVGGWRDRDSEGHYGIRGWITIDDTTRLGLRPDDVDSSLSMRRPAPPPIGTDEIRLGPAESEYASVVTVTCEEHYQPMIAATMPQGWNPKRSWPVLVDLVVVGSNPHKKQDGQCIEVRVGQAAVGFFTQKMTERHHVAVSDAIRSGKRATANGSVSSGVKGGVELLRIKVEMPRD